jgi:hypothetical protein
MKGRSKGCLAKPHARVKDGTICVSRLSSYAQEEGTFAAQSKTDLLIAHRIILWALASLAIVISGAAA